MDVISSISVNKAATMSTKRKIPIPERLIHMKSKVEGDKSNEMEQKSIGKE
jgi:hypothetical protein